MSSYKNFLNNYCSSRVTRDSFNVLRFLLPIGLVASILFISLGCQKKPSRKPFEAETWEPYISAFTSGVISREGTVRVVLRNDAAAGPEINLPIEDSPLSFEPRIKGTAWWIDSRTIEFRPEKPLKQGIVYKAAFQVHRYAKVPEKLRMFNFEFATIKQSIDVTVDVLEPMSKDDLKWQRIRGKVLTADVENAEKIEKVLSVRQNSKVFSPRWEHDAGRQIHVFVIDSIQRSDDSSTLEIAWNGKELGIDVKSRKTIQVPAIGDFSILEARSLKVGEQGISIRFSDPLSVNQNLSGLIVVQEDPSTRFAISGNEVRVYFSKRLGGVIHCTVNPGILNIARKRFSETVTLDVTIESIKPAVRFVGKGVILPDAANLVVPFEAVNLSAVDARVIRIYENNIPQFLQVNDLEGESELRRVGRVVLQETILLNTTAGMQDRWARGGFDVSPLVNKEPGALYRIELYFKRDYSLYPCAESDSVNFRGRTQKNPRPDDDDTYEDEESEYSYWSFYDEYYENIDWSEWNRNRENPCHPAYYDETWEHTISAKRNFLASNIGLTAKKGVSDTVAVTVTDLSTTRPISDADVRIHNYQNQVIGRAKTDNEGFAVVVVSGAGKPYLLIADNGTQKGYLRLDAGSSLPISHFDVGGAAVQKGFKGMVYGERGVWRPGDSLYLVFVLRDASKRLPPNHPATLELVNPQGQIAQTVTCASPVGSMYDLRTATSPDAPTGNYTARVKVGGAVFEQTIKIEMVMPNRLKINLDFETDTLICGTINGRISARWLTGAVARSLKADVEMSLQQAPTGFIKHKDFIFDDPVRRFESQKSTIFDGAIDAEGNASFTASVSARETPGMLRANFRTRVFEAGGAFSVDKLSMPLSPYKQYVGILMPRGDRARGMLLTDTEQNVQVVTVSPSGAPVSVRRIEMRLYKIEWRWWWERNEESFADYISAQNHKPYTVDTISTTDGKGVWTFMVKYPEWGRFLIRAVDLDGGHATGTSFYIDWPNWAGRAQKEIRGGVTVLAFSADKPEYTVGEKATLTVPSSAGGRILISLENGSGVLRRFWVDSRDQETAIPVDIQPDMAPTTYIFASYIQKYAQTVNDLPMRMYGVIPISVVDPETRLQPVIDAPAVMEPEKRAVLSVREEKGREMTYTLALVDEGLLDLTRFETPDLWKHFYKREALGVMSWDMFDLVCGAYGASLERLLAIGGDEALVGPGQKRGNRFPPMVRFYGPFHCKKGSTEQHTIDIPQYVGSVRIMVVAAWEGAYGQAEQAVPVRKPLMMLGTMPRVIGPKERVKLPISIFALEPSIKNVTVSVKTEGPLFITGEKKKKMQFTQIGDELVEFDVEAGETPGWAKVDMSASGNGQRAEQTIEIEVRNASQPVSVVHEKTLQAGESWELEFTMPGVAGTNSAYLELSRIPPLDISRRVNYLIDYPHMCAEQITSSAFPQLFLPKVVDLPDKEKVQIQRDVQEVLQRIPAYQTTSGGFTFWPGGGDADPWVTSYTGHFLLEAKQAGYSVPEYALQRWKQYQSQAANIWSGSSSQAELVQAYRLYTLALAGDPHLAAMNRMRESGDLDVTARWRLAAAYALAGHADPAKQLISNQPTKAAEYREPGQTYGSAYRDLAMILETLVLMKEMEKAAQVAKDLASSMSSSSWMSTQTTAYALCAMAKFAAASSLSDKIDMAFSINKGKEAAVVTALPLSKQALSIDPEASKATIVCKNRSKAIGFIRLILRGTPAIGEEKEVSEGIEMSVRYLTKKGEEMKPYRIEQGADFIAEVTLAAEGGRGPFEQVVLSQLVASGWEILNTRFEGFVSKDEGVFNYRDIRDDRLYTYFTLPMNGSKRFRVFLHASYIGTYYLPGVRAYAMYDESTNAASEGKWVEVVEAGK